jgi:hypothetical protein
MGRGNSCFVSAIHARSLYCQDQSRRVSSAKLRHADCFSLRRTRQFFSIFQRNSRSVFAVESSQRSFVCLSAGSTMRIDHQQGDAMKRFLILVAALTMIGVMGWAAPTQAAPITYTETSIASGTLGGTPFTDALVTVELTADTSGVIEPAPGVFVNQGTATVTIDGLGTATFNDPNGYAAVFFPQSVFPNCPCFAFFDDAAHFPSSGTAIFVLGDASLAGYDLQSAFGPLTGTGGGLATEPNGSPVAFSTTAGTLFLTDGGDPVTLTVTVNPVPVPEPASLSLFAVGALGAITARRRRQRQNS